VGAEQYGFRAIVAPSFADIFFNNCYKSGLLPIVLTEAQIDQLFNEVKAFPGFRWWSTSSSSAFRTADGSLSLSEFEIDAFRKYCLLNGLDDIGLTLRHADEIRAFEERHLASQPWLANTSSEKAAINMKIAILPGDGIGPEIMRRPSRS
jgi:3-isopropylmalate/(R)-2-methylmalate dehydratase small subunit